MIDQDDVNLRIQAYNMHQQDRSRTPEDWFAFLTADAVAPVVPLHAVPDPEPPAAPPYEQDSEGNPA